MMQPSPKPTRRPDVVVIGASCRAAAQCASREGFRPFAMDAYMDRDLLECAEAYPRDPIATEIGASLVGPAGTCDPASVDAPNARLAGLPLLLAGGMENDPAAVDHWIALGLRSGVNGSQIQTLRDPVQWERWASASGLRMPDTLLRYPPGNHELREKATGNAESLWLCKMRESAGGVGISYCGFHEQPGPPPDGVTGLQKVPGCYWQRHIPGIPMGVTMISDSVKTQCVGAALAIQSHQVWGPTPFAYRGSIGPWTLDATWYVPLARFGETVRVETGVLGLWQADFIVDDHGLWLLEINPRWSASMELLADANRYKLIQWHLAAMRGEAIARVEPRCSSVWLGKSVVYARCEITPETSQLEALWRRRWSGWSANRESDWRVADIPNTTTKIPAGAPIATCMACGRDQDELIARLQRGGEEISALLNQDSMTRG